MQSYLPFMSPVERCQGLTVVIRLTNLSTDRGALEDGQSRNV